MNSTRIYAIFLRQIFLLRHNPTRFINLFLWTTLDVVLWGFVTRYLNTLGYAGFSFVPIFLGAIILFNYLVRVQQGVMIAFFEDVWSNNFLNLFSSPLSVGEYISGIVVTAVVTSFAGLLFVVILAGVAFGFSVFSLGVLLILFMLGLALGIFTMAMTLRLGPSAEWFGWPLPFLLSPFSGVFYPIAVLPSYLRPIAYFVPSSYVFEGMRAVLFSSSFQISSLVVGFALALIYLLLAYFFFHRTYRYVVRAGLLARFSAEG